MSSSIRSVNAATPALDPKKAAESKLDPRVKKAAEEFEGALLRQLLQAAKIGGKTADKGYGGMAVDALASGLQSAGGLGLAKAIEDALARSHMAKGK